MRRKGWSARADAPADRRAYTVKLTAGGRALFARMAAAHEQWVIDLFSGLTSTDKAQTHRLLAKLKLHVAGVTKGTD